MFSPTTKRRVREGAGYAGQTAAGSLAGRYIGRAVWHAGHPVQSTLHRAAGAAGTLYASHVAREEGVRQGLATFAAVRGLRREMFPQLRHFGRVGAGIGATIAGAAALKTLRKRRALRMAQQGGQ